MLVVLAAGSSWIYSVIMSAFPLVTRLFFQSVADRAPVMDNSTSTRSFFPSIKVAESIPCVWPAVAVSFKGRIPTEVEEKLMEWGADIQKIGGNRSDSYLLSSPTLDQLGELLRFKNLDVSFQTPVGHISPLAIPTLFTLVTRITVALRVVNFIYRTTVDDDLLEVSPADEGTQRDTGRVIPAGGGGEDDGMGEEGEIQVHNERKEFFGDDSMGMFFRVDTLAVDLPPNYGPSDALPPTPGLLIPFETNYAGTDPLAINTFIRNFSNICIQDPLAADEEIDELIQYWVKEICRTDLGDRLAHIMTILDMAIRGRTGVYLIFRPDDHYGGSVLCGSHFMLKQPGVGITDSCDQQTLEQDIRLYGFHETAVRAILLLIGSDVEVKDVRTMRHLRELVMEHGEPSGNIRNQIEKQLQKVSFIERPLGVHSTSLATTFNLLSDPSVVLPSGLYLHREDFFAIDRVRLVLSAFGKRVPSFSYGGVRRRATARIGKGTAGIEEYSATPPLVLQTKSIPMQTAVPHWNSMMQTGIVSSDFQTRTDGSRVFTGSDKAKVWRDLGEFLEKTVKAPGTAGPSIAPTGELGQKRRETDAPSGGREKRMRSFF